MHMYRLMAQFGIIQKSVELHVFNIKNVKNIEITNLKLNYA
jgi:hypothetical protein